MKLEIERTEREQDQSRSQNEAKFKWKHQQEKMNRFSFFFFLCVPPWRISWVEISASWVTRNSAGQRRHHHSLVTFLSERRQVADLIPFQSSAIIYFIYLFFWILNFEFWSPCSFTKTLCVPFLSLIRLFCLFGKMARRRGLEGRPAAHFVILGSHCLFDYSTFLFLFLGKTSKQKQTQKICSAFLFPVPQVHFKIINNNKKTMWETWIAVRRGVSRVAMKHRAKCHCPLHLSLPTLSFSSPTPILYSSRLIFYSKRNWTRKVCYDHSPFVLFFWLLCTDNFFLKMIHFAKHNGDRLRQSFVPIMTDM